MDRSSIPQPRYCKEYVQQAIEEQRPLFTLDIYWPKGTKSPSGLKRSTVTGVATEEEIESAMARVIALRLKLPVKAV